ncbi:MAG TPA: DUF4337 family protein [Gemmatales bacterium]|nr:DUF4337 family protein [Gemmatales bacterium]
MPNPTEALKHAEYSTHANSRFDRRVAMTIAIIAALVTTMHSFETEAQAESLKNEIEASKVQTNAANAWSYYQAKNIRDNMYESMEELSSIVPAQDATAREKATERWRKQREKYNIELKDNMEEAVKREKQSEILHARSEEQHKVASRTGRATLLLELAIVVTTLAVLTRKSGFWLIGCIIGGIGAIYGGCVLIPHFLAGY